MEENELYDRIGETDLNPTYKDGQPLMHIDMNNIVSIVKEGVNENYYDIQKLQNGEKTVGNADKLDGAAMSRYIDEPLQADDNKVPSSQQAKAYVDALFSGYSAPVRGVDYWTSSDKQEIIDEAASSTLSEITPDLEEALDAKANINDLPTKTSELQNDSGFLAENNLQMTKIIDVQNGTQLIDATGYSRINKILGNTSQNGTPTPSNPVNISVVTGDISIVVSNSDSSSSKTFPISLGDIELCKIDTNVDYLYNQNGKWYLHKEIEKVIFNGSENWLRYNGNLYVQSITDYRRTSNIPVCSHYKGVSMTAGTVTPTEQNNNTIRFSNNSNLLNSLYVMDSSISSASDFKTWLSTHNITLYYILATPLTIEITDDNLLKQLNAIYNAQLYSGTTNFSITSNNLLPIFNITYAITDRDFYSKEEADDRMYKEVKSIDKTLKFYTVSKSSATYIVQFPNGKNLIVDTGQSTQWSDIKTAIDGLGITKFDYLILTHFHSDHKGNIQNLCDNYDLSNCVCWVGMKPDFTNHSEDIGETESSYDDTITLLENNNLTPIVPVNNSFFEIDENTKLHFLNTSSEIAENYYGRITEYRNQKVLNFNHFSLITELIFNDKVITFTGDIERVNEEYMNVYMRKADIITSPHHGVNIAAYKPFYENIRPQYSLNMYISDSNTWIKPFYNSFMYLKELGCRMITPDCTEAINGLYSFIISKTKVQFLNNGDSQVAPGREAPVMYTQINQIFDRSKILASELTLEQLFDAMLPSSTLQVYFWHSYSETYPTLYSDIRTIFPTFTGGKISLFKDLNLYKEIVVNNSSSALNLKATSHLETYSMTPAFSSGVIPNITDTSNLITALENYPIGAYLIDSFSETEDNTVLVSNGAYQLYVNIVNNNSSGLWANIIAILRDTTGSTDVCRTASCYINTTSTPQYKWLKLN